MTETYDQSQNIWDKFKFSCEIAYYVKSSISVFQESFAGTHKIFISGGGGLRTRQ